MLEQLTIEDLRTIRNLVAAQQAAIYSKHSERDREERSKLARINRIISEQIEAS